MNRSPFYLSLLLLLTCAKEDSQDPGTTPSNIAPRYTLTASAGEGGSVSPTTGSFNAGTQVSVTATPNSGYQFTSWSNGSTANPVTVTLNSNTSITANFEVLINSYTLTVVSTDGGSATGAGEYNEGTEVTLTATASEGYRFTGWSDGSTEESITISLNSDTALTANFEVIPMYTVTYSEFDLNPISNLLTRNAFNKMPVGFYHLNEDNFFLIPSYFFEYPALPILNLKENGNYFELIDYTESDIEVPREIKNINQNKVVIVDQGMELANSIPNEWPFSNVWLYDFQDRLITKINPERKFYHSLAYFDLDGDNNNEIIAMAMNTRSGPWGGDGYIETYKNNNGDYELYNFFQKDNGLELDEWNNYSSGSIAVDNFFGDSRPEILKLAYRPDWDPITYSFMIYSQNENNKYELLNIDPSQGLFDEEFGSSKPLIMDIDNDGFKDIIVFFEKPQNIGVQTFINNQLDGFNPGQIITTSDLSTLWYREGELDDIDSDGDLDLILNGWAFYAHSFDQNNQQLLINNYIYLNKNGSFFKASTEEFKPVDFPYDNFSQAEYFRYIPDKKAFYVIGVDDGGVLKIGKIKLML